jgi:uncharacterized protein YqhQ
MPDHSSPRFGETMAYLLCIIVSTAMIWYLLLSIFAPCNPCREKTLDYIFLIPFVLIIAYSKIRLLILLFPARIESCGICSLIS